jgi:hypothetical protein
MRAAKAVNITKTRSSSRVVRRTISREYFPGPAALEGILVGEAITFVVPRIEYRIERAKGKAVKIYRKSRDCQD